MNNNEDVFEGFDSSKAEAISLRNFKAFVEEEKADAFAFESKEISQRDDADGKPCAAFFLLVKSEDGTGVDKSRLDEAEAISAIIGVNITGFLSAMGVQDETEEKAIISNFVKIFETRLQHFGADSFFYVLSKNCFFIGKNLTQEKEKHIFEPIKSTEFVDIQQLMSAIAPPPPPILKTQGSEEEKRLD